MSELRLYLRRDSFLEGKDCAWALLDDAGHIQGSGNRLEDLPRSRSCRLVLSSELVLTVKATLPDLPERRLAPLLPAAAEASTLVDADSIHTALLERGADGEVTLAVVEESWIGRVLPKLEAMGLRPDAALPEYLLLPRTPGSWSVCWRGGDTLARFGEAEGMALDDGEPPVGLSLALAQRERPESVRVYQGGGMGAPDWTRWRAALDARVEEAGPWDWRASPWPASPGLLQGKYSPNRSRLDWKRIARPLVWGAAILAGIQLAGLTLDWALLARESADIKQEMRVLAERVLPAHAAVVDPAWQVAERLQNLHAASGNPTADALMGLLGRLGQVWPLGGNNPVQSVSYDLGALTVTLAGVEAPWLDQLKAAGKARGLAINVLEDKDAGKGIRISVRPEGKEDRHGQ